jgi:hypothetical protein
MTCRHVLGLIDAGPFADHPAPHLEAAWAHAGSCPTCGPALRTSRALTGELQRLAQPPVPGSVATTVMARIARLEAPALSDVAHAPSAAASSPLVGLSVWGSAACLTAGVMIIAATVGSGAAGWSDWSIRPTTQDLIASSPSTLAALALGLVSYFVGLTMPLIRRRT